MGWPFIPSRPVGAKPKNVYDSAAHFAARICTRSRAPEWLIAQRLQSHGRGVTGCPADCLKKLRAVRLDGRQDRVRALTRRRLLVAGLALLFVMGGAYALASWDWCGPWAEAPAVMEASAVDHGPLRAGAARTSVTVPFPIVSAGYG